MLNVLNQQVGCAIRTLLVDRLVLVLAREKPEERPVQALHLHPSDGDRLSGALGPYAVVSVDDLSGIDWPGRPMRRGGVQISPYRPTFF